MVKKCVMALAWVSPSSLERSGRTIDPTISGGATCLTVIARRCTTASRRSALRANWRTADWARDSELSR